MNNTPKNHSPELRPNSEAMLERSQVVEASAFYFETLLYADFWATDESRTVQGAGAVIDRTFLEMQPRIKEATDELSA